MSLHKKTDGSLIHCTCIVILSLSISNQDMTNIHEILPVYTSIKIINSKTFKHQFTILMKFIANKHNYTCWIGFTRFKKGVKRKKEDSSL